MKFFGGCFCGAIRFQCDENPIETACCHCSICRRTTGAPLLAFATFSTKNFTYTKGTPSIFKSSATGKREFCNNCGTQICFRTTDTPEIIDIISGTLDEPEKVAPTHHIYTSSKLSWIKLDDQLPCYKNECTA